jgi:hypothetical protein
VIATRIKALLRRFRWRLTDKINPKPVAIDFPPLPLSRPLRIGFVVCDPAKWGLSSILQELHADPDFEVGFYLTLSDVHLRLPHQHRSEKFSKVQAFFANLGTIWGTLYNSETDTVASSEIIDCDVVFIQQPWGMQDLPRLLSGRIRTAFVHYGVPVIKNDRMQFGLPDFHPFLWRYFVATEVHADAIRATIGPQPSVIRITGHPKFDAYLSAAPQRKQCLDWPNPGDEGRKRVIFAPHHSFENDSLCLGTFEWSGQNMLDLVHKHPEIDFLLRPHPNMAIGLLRSGIMTSQAWEAFNENWAASPNARLFDGNPYFDVFRTSDVLITDSGSFLAEYLPTGAPLIRLERADAAPLNDFGKKLDKGFYKARNRSELEAIFTDVVEMEHDPLEKIRFELVPLLIPFTQSAAEIIAHELRVSM